MNTDADIWMGFISTLGMLFVVLAFFLLAFYLFKKLGGGMGKKAAGGLIRVLAVHHLSPKEKLVLVRVHKETLFLGVTPSRISRLANLGNDPALMETTAENASGFAEIFGRAINKKTLKNQMPQGGEADHG